MPRRFKAWYVINHLDPYDGLYVTARYKVSYYYYYY